MTELALPVGLGLAARGSVSDAVTWVEDARRLGFDSVWIHDSYFERDAVSYASAIASQVPDIRVALGAVNPFTRHPVLIAMTVSALDQMAPQRIVLGLGSALPLRLAQMGIPYEPATAVDRIDAAIDTIRAMWRGERTPPGSPNVPPVEPMFPPVHHVPIYVAGYRTPMLELAGRKGDGYLARPLESLASFRTMVPKIRRASVEASRPEDAVGVAGYLFALVDRSRREALNRAKREPFVTYMLAIQTDVAMHRAGFELDLRDRVFAAWRAEDYHQAAGLVPDDLLDAFLLCGRREDVVARMAEYHEAGMDLPILQPVLQNEDQVAELLATGVEYATGATALVGSPAAPGVTGGSGHSGQPSAPDRIRRRLGAWYEIMRPFSFTASTVPVAAAGALAAFQDRFHWGLFVAALLASLFLHIGTNVTNEIFDVRKGIDSITSPRASHALVKGRLTEREAFVLAGVAFAVAASIGVWLIAERGWVVAVLGIAGILGGFGYTGPPFQFKFRALGLPLVFVLMGPLMVVGAFFVVTGSFDWRALVMSVPVGLLVTAILHGNEWRDIAEDARAGIATFSIRAGRRAAHIGYVSLVVGAYVALCMAVATKVLPPLSLLAVLSLPLLVRAIRASELGAAGQQRAIAMIDLETAQLHAAFGFLLVAGLAAASAGG
jgi:1,4-dihydroxy-2-naphthoate octaprenyltransferase